MTPVTFIAKPIGRSASDAARYGVDTPPPYGTSREQGQNTLSPAPGIVGDLEPSRSGFETRTSDITLKLRVLIV